MSIGVMILHQMTRILPANYADTLMRCFVGVSWVMNLLKDHIGTYRLIFPSTWYVIYKRSEPQVPTTCRQSWLSNRSKNESILDILEYMVQTLAFKLQLKRCTWYSVVWLSIIHVRSLYFINIVSERCYNRSQIHNSQDHQSGALNCSQGEHSVSPIHCTV